jgi:hypothetical protein
MRGGQRVQFTSSLLWTEQRKRTVITQIEAFDKYLEVLQISIPAKLPLISILEGKTSVDTYGSPKDIPFAGHIGMATMALDPLNIRRRYAQYVFRIALDPSPPTTMSHTLDDHMRISSNLQWTSLIYAEYFAGSSLDRQPLVADPYGWEPALWEIRTACGKDFTDRASQRLQCLLLGKVSNGYGSSR